MKKLKYYLTIKNGKDYKNAAALHGTYNVYGTGGVIAKIDEFLYDKPSILIGRKGTITKPLFVENPFWTIDTLFYTEVFSEKCIAKALYYYLSLLPLEKLDEGSTIPSLTQSTLYDLNIFLPPIIEQQHIVDIMKSKPVKIF